MSDFVWKVECPRGCAAVSVEDREQFVKIKNGEFYGIPDTYCSKCHTNCVWVRVMKEDKIALYGVDVVYDKELP